MRILPRIPPAVARKLGHYVYLYVNPLDRSIFYVGKGKGARALAHLDDAEKGSVAKTIRTIRAAGAEPEIEILAHALPSAEIALQVEAAVIDALGVAGLANAVRVDLPGFRGQLSAFDSRNLLVSSALECNRGVRGVSPRVPPAAARAMIHATGPVEPFPLSACMRSNSFGER